MEWNVFINSFLQALLTAALPVVVVLIGKFLQGWIKVKLAEIEQQKPYAFGIVKDVVLMAVQAAEQANVAGLIEDKREFAFGIAEKFLSQNGITIDIDQIYAAIEAAVLEEFNKVKPE